MGEARRKRQITQNGFQRKVESRSAELSLDLKIEKIREEINRTKREAIKRAFPVGTWVFGIWRHKGCSEVLIGSDGSLQPFDYLKDYDASHYRVATPGEVLEAMNRVFGERMEAAQ